MGIFKSYPYLNKMEIQNKKQSELNERNIQIGNLNAKKITEIETKETVTLNPPVELTINNVVYWSNTFKRLRSDGEKAVTTKAHHFLQDGKVRYDSEFNVFRVDPARGNKTTRTILTSNNRFECNCQNNQTTGRICSHILAVKLWLKIKNWKNKDESI